MLIHVRNIHRNILDNINLADMANKVLDKKTAENKH